jgi:hypothetical protein
MAVAWNLTEGFDIHVLRGGPPSKSLAAAVRIFDGGIPATLKFVADFDGAPDNLGVRVNEATGEVRAFLPPANTSQIELHNFLLHATVINTSGQTDSVMLRVHVHTSIKDIWLTPSTLTIHQGSNNCRFTVLAEFTEGTIGDITEWTQLTYRSQVPGTSTPSPDVSVASDGVLTTVNANKVAEITVTVALPVTLTTPSSLTSAPVQAITKPSWDDMSAAANVTFVVAGLRLKADDPQKSGIVVPNKADPDSSNRDSVASVIANAPNVLFVSEGFSGEQEFVRLVNRIVEDLRTQDHLQPYKLLQDSINYWSVFVPSHDDGISVLGDHYIDVPKAGAHPMYFPKAPSSAATEWSIENMIHQVGLPVASDPTKFDELKSLWTFRYGNKNYSTLAAKNFAKWRDIDKPGQGRLAILNDQDTAFGMRIRSRPRAIETFSRVKMGADARRTADADTFKFIHGLRYGTHNIGAKWKTDAKHNLICLLCQCQRHGGTAWGYFLSSTGRDGHTNVRLKLTARGAASYDVDLPALAAGQGLALSTVVGHELSHKLGLADEYGDGAATFRNDDHNEPNLVPKKNIVIATATTPPRIKYDKTSEIKWLWPRLTKAAIVTSKPQASGSRFKFKVKPNTGPRFKMGDIVRFRQNRPVLIGPTQDTIFNFPQGFHLIVTSHTGDTVEAGIGQPGGILHDLESPVASNPGSKSWEDLLSDLFKADTTYALVCPLRVGTLGGGSEVKLIADSVRAHIAATHAPLNAPMGNTSATHETAVCVANYSGTVTPTNLPALTKKPANPQDIIGIYEGGGGHDCGVFRPAGRCKMRQGDDASVVFCHVCRYAIVDFVDPGKHGELDLLYPEVG